MVKNATAGPLFSAMVLLVSLVACAAPQRPDSEVLERSPSLPKVFQSGLAIAPTGYAQPTAENMAVAARFSDVLYIEALTLVRGVEILSPGIVHERLARQRGTALGALQAARRALASDVSPAPEALRDIADRLGQRYLLVTWVDERAMPGLEDLPLDFTDEHFANETGRAEFGRLEGDLHGVVLDLEGAELLWTGRAHYQADEDFGFMNRELRDLEDELRDGAAYDLIGLLMSSR